MKKNACLALACWGTLMLASPLFAQVNGLDGFSDRVVISDTGDGTARWAVDASTATGFGDGVEDAAVLFGTVTDIHLLGDVNNDGITDKVLVRDDGGGNWLWMADFSTPTAFGDGVADELSLFGAASVHIPVGIGDLNGDGFTDRFLVEVTPTAMLWIVDDGVSGGSGDGTADEFSLYGAGTNALPAVHTPLGVADVDNDGRVDRVINVNNPAAGDPPSWAADFSTGTAPNEMGDGAPDTNVGFGAPGDSNLLLGDMNNDGFADRVVVQTVGPTPNWVADFTFAPLGFFGDGVGDIFQTATFGTNNDEFLLADIININGTAPILGDFDSDLDVDSADLANNWEIGFGTASGAAIADGDADFDGDVDGTDFLLWQTNFGIGVPALAASAVPEPSSLITLVVGFVGVLLGVPRKLSV